MFGVIAVAAAVAAAGAVAAAAVVAAAAAVFSPCKAVCWSCLKLTLQSRSSPARALLPDQKPQTLNPKP